MRFINFNNVLTCFGDTEEEAGISIFCDLYDRYKQYFTLFNFINLLNDYLRFDDLDLFPDYLEAIYHIKK